MKHCHLWLNCASGAWHIYIYYTTIIWLPWLPDLCKLNQNEADSEFILSPSELMSGRGVSVTSKLWIRLLVSSGVSVTSNLWIRLLRRKSNSCCSALAGMAWKSKQRQNVTKTTLQQILDPKLVYSWMPDLDESVNTFALPYSPLQSLNKWGI